MGCLALTNSYGAPAQLSRPRAKVLYLANACAVLKADAFHAALECHGVTIGRLAMVLGCSKTTAARLISGKAPSDAQRAIVMARWGGK